MFSYVLKAHSLQYIRNPRHRDGDTYNAGMGNFRELWIGEVPRMYLSRTRANGLGYSAPMTSYGFLSAAFVVVLLTGVALLAGASAVKLAPFDRFERHQGKVFLGCMVGIWAVAVLVIWLVKRTT
jgi:hypothetical protein